jgi:hypothetical protein
VPAPNFSAPSNRSVHRGSVGGSRRNDGYLGCCRWVIGHAEQSLGSQSGESHAPFIGVGVPVDEVAAGDLPAGGVVRVEDLQAQRVERVVLVDGRVAFALGPVGFDVADAVRVTLVVDGLVQRLGRAAD